MHVSLETGVQLFVYVEGAQSAEPSLLAVHGGPDWDHSYLVEPLRQLAGKRQVLIPDVVGCGRSSRPTDRTRYSPDSVAADFVDLIDALDLDKVDLLGFSWGGQIAQRIAVRAPERINRLIIASSTALPVPDDAFANRPDRDRLVAAEVQVWANESVRDRDFARLAAVAAADSAIWRSERRDEYLARVESIRFGVEWLRQMRAGLLRPALPPDPIDSLSATGIPILFLHGEHDMTFPVTLVREAARRIPNAQVCIVSESAHMTHIDDPEKWITAVHRFLTEPSATPAKID